jgi:tetratricopeptide (TPR) repeat protein
MDTIFQALYIDKLSAFIAGRFNIPLSMNHLNYIITFILILVLFFSIRHILKKYLLDGSYLNESRRLKAHEKNVRKNIKNLLSVKDYKAAAELYVSIDELREAAKLYIKARVPVKAAEVYELMGSLGNAAALYKEANNHTKSAELFEKIGDYQNAAQSYEKGGFFKKAAELYKKINDYPKAGELYERCFIEEGPRIIKEGKDKSYAYLSGMFYEKAGEFEKAISIYLKDGYYKEAALVYENLGELVRAAEFFMEAGELERAAEMFQLGGDEKRSNEVLSKISYQKGFLKEAATLAEKAGDSIKSAEIFAEAKEYARAGEQYLKGGWYKEAGEMFMKAGDFKRAAEAFELGGDYALAAHAYEKTGTATAKGADLYEKVGDFFKAGKSYMELGLQDRALNVLQKIDEKSENYESASIMIGEIFMDKDMIKLAKERFLKIIGRRPISKETLEPYYYLALCFERSGKDDLAKSTYDKILAVDYQFKDVSARSNKITVVLNEKSISGQRVQDDISVKGRSTLPKDSLKKRYELLLEVGRGGMGIVYKAKDTLLDRIVAYKILPSFLSTNPSNFDRFLKEARLSANLNHMNIIMIFDTGYEGELSYITMEYVEGETLDKILKGGRKFKIAEVVSIAKQVCRALAYAHKNNVVHRDIKPANILMNKKGVIKIMDFGIAKILEDISKEVTSISGTPLYMSPEQIIGKDVDFQTDLYSFGVTIFELATGRPPFTEGDIFYHHLHTVPISPKELNPSIPDGLCKVILKCLEKDKALRYKRAVEILRDLDDFQDFSTNS